MPLLLTGEIGNFNTTGDPTFATGTVPTNGDDVDAPVVATLVKRLLDFDAQLASDLDAANTQLLQRFTDGPSFLRTVSSIADLKAVNTTGMIDGSIRILKDPTIAGGNVSRVGMFIFDSSATEAECAIPAATDAYLVVTPNVGGGRWFNVAASVGWKLGVAPEFLPKPRERVVRWQQSAIAGTSVGLTVGAWTPMLPTLSPVLGLNDDFDFDFDVTWGFGAADNEIEARVEVSYAGGGYTPVNGVFKKISQNAAAGVTQWVGLHFGGRINASSGAGTYTFRVAARTLTVNTTANGAGTWNARGIQYVAL